MTKRKKRFLILLAVAVVLLIPANHWFRLQFGLLNQGQEFGTYGQYNRVLRLVREAKDYEVVNSRLSRRLDWRNLGHLDRFSVTMRDTEEKTATIEFLRDSPEMKERDPQVLEKIIRAKWDAAAGQSSP